MPTYRWPSDTLPECKRRTTATPAEATLEVRVRYQPDVTDAESVAAALDQLLETALSTPDILGEYGVVEVDAFYVRGYVETRST